MADAAPMDWEVYADGLEQLLLRLTEEYGVERIYVTENGSAFQDTVAADGSVHDPERVRYLEEHLAACARAVAKGAPLAGYFAWSLLDDFEWAYGYDKRFGLVHVDYATQRRTVKTSGRRYAELVREHAGRRAGPVA
ncbi:Beta-glucosidase OS=Streptomyces microflavus OX=1919 GN=Smic_73820 PE=3 SV=1 [Streptomyces microflavus]